MFVQIVPYACPHWIKDKVNAFPPGQFGGGDEITVPSHQDYLKHLAFKGHRSYIQTNAHVHSFLGHVILDIGIPEVFKCGFPGK